MNLISVKEAQKRTIELARETGSEIMQTEDALGKVFTEDVVAPVSHPSFDQSAVDGFGLRSEGLPETGKDVVSFFVQGEVKAGDHPNVNLTDGKALRIFTGAPIPAGIDTVVMQEYVEQEGAVIGIKPKHFKKGANIRRKGEQIKSGDVALSKGTAITAAGIGFLRSLGINEVQVARRPKVSVIVTGGEFIENDQPLTDGKIYESNGAMLRGALHHLTGDITYDICQDDQKRLSEVISKAADRAQVLIITGGVSVGKYDFTRASLEDNGFETIFHKVNQKPGKPLLVCKRGDKIAFGLPGNPLSVLICFYEYVYPVLRKMTGHNDPYLNKIRLPLLHDHQKWGDKTHFVTANIETGGFSIHGTQGSHMLGSMATSTAIAVLPEEKTEFFKDELIELHLLPDVS